jgi:ABC-type transport system involved in multi-copper enzyme maturation permease subunit
MNATLVTAFLRQRLTSPIRLLLIGFQLVTSLGMVAVMRSLDSIEGQGLLFGFVLAAGAIGQEVASGVLTLTFARPITRTTYVLSRWFGAGALGAGIGLAQLTLGLAIVVMRSGPAPAAGDLAALALETVTLAFTGAAVLVMLSSVANGLGDVGLWALGLFTASMLEGLGQIKNWPALVRAAQELEHVFFPRLRLGWLFGHGDVSWFTLVSVLSTLALSLALAVWIVNRKELSYAAG